MPMIIPKRVDRQAQLEAQERARPPRPPECISADDTSKAVIKPVKTAPPVASLTIMLRDPHLQLFCSHQSAAARFFYNKRHIELLISGDISAAYSLGAVHRGRLTTIVNGFWKRVEKPEGFLYFLEYLRLRRERIVAPLGKYSSELLRVKDLLFPMIKQNADAKAQAEGTPTITLAGAKVRLLTHYVAEMRARFDAVVNSIDDRAARPTLRPILAYLKFQAHLQKDHLINTIFERAISSIAMEHEEQLETIETQYAKLRQTEHFIEAEDVFTNQLEMMGGTGEIYALSPDASEGADKAYQLFGALLPEHMPILIEEDEHQLVRNMVMEAVKRLKFFMRRPRKRAFSRFAHED